MSCPNCGAGDRQVLPVYEHEDKREDDSEHPNYIACTSCNQLMRPHLLRDEDDEIPPQARLSQDERDWLAARNMVGNQHSNRLSIIEWQVVKGAAMYYGVEDWRSKSDSTLTAEENVSLMERYGHKNNESTMRKLKSKVQ